MLREKHSYTCQKGCIGSADFIGAIKGYIIVGSTIIGNAIIESAMLCCAIKGGTIKSRPSETGPGCTIFGGDIVGRAINRSAIMGCTWEGAWKLGGGPWIWWQQRLRFEQCWMQLQWWFAATHQLLYHGGYCKYCIDASDCVFVIDIQALPLTYSGIEIFSCHR